jgi:predicted nucleic acid-binding protein
MEKESLVLCDTNIIIEFYKENKIIIYSLKTIGQKAIAVSIITSGEIYDYKTVFTSC